MSVNDDLYDASVRHQVYLLRLSTATVNKLIRLLNAVDTDLVAQITKYDPTEVSGTYSERRLKRMLEAIREINRDAYNIVNRELTSDLLALGSYEASFAARSLAGTVQIALDVTTPSVEQLKAAVNAKPFQGRILKEWGRDLEEAAFRRVRDSIRMGYVEGEPIDSIVRRIRGTRAQGYADGILQTNRRNVESVVRTAINHTATAARQETFRANADLIKGWRFVATLDGRTTVQCASLDGKVFDVGTGPLPPRHFNCRSTMAPVTKSWRELGFDIDELPVGTRASMNGQVPATETYQTWLRRQPAEFQDEVLGASKGKLFRRGNLPLEKFVDLNGAAMSLDDLRRTEAAAFQKAGLAA